MSIKSLWKEASADFDRNSTIGKLAAGAQTALSTAIAVLGIEDAVVASDYISAAGAAVFAVGNMILARFDLKTRAKQIDSSGPGGMQ